MILACLKADSSMKFVQLALASNMYILNWKVSSIKLDCSMFGNEIIM